MNGTVQRGIKSRFVSQIGDNFSPRKKKLFLNFSRNFGISEFWMSKILEKSFLEFFNLSGREVQRQQCRVTELSYLKYCVLNHFHNAIDQ